jgi:hypothetical protein
MATGIPWWPGRFLAAQGRLRSPPITDIRVVAGHIVRCSDEEAKIPEGTHATVPGGVGRPDSTPASGAEGQVAGHRGQLLTQC